MIIVIRRKFMPIDIVATFMGLLIMSFLIERLLEIFSSIVDCWIMWPNASTETGIRRYFPPIDKKTTEKYVECYERLTGKKFPY